MVELPANLVTEVVKLWNEERKMDTPDLEERIDWWLEEGGDEFVLFFSFTRLFHAFLILSFLPATP